MITDHHSPAQRWTAVGLVLVVALWCAISAAIAFMVL